jgi:hypothetical protein
LSAVLEYLSAELLELGGNKSRDRQSDTINVADIEAAVRDDEELACSFESFSSRYVISVLEHDNSDSKTMHQSKAVAQFIFSTTQSSLLEGSCVSFMETFLVEAACACASQKLSLMRVNLLIEQLTLLCSGEAFKSFHRSSHCFPMIAALELVSLCGGKAVVPFASDHNLTHLRLRLSSHVHIVCEISDARRYSTPHALHRVEVALLLVLIHVLQCCVVFVPHCKDDGWVVYRQIQKVSKLLYSSTSLPVVTVRAV